MTRYTVGVSAARKFVAVPAVAALVFCGIPAGSAAAAAEPASSGEAERAVPGSRAPVVGTPQTTTVTLLTGDRVTVRALAEGRRKAVVEPAKRPQGAAVTFAIFDDGEHLYVIPSDVLAAVDKTLDRNLFDVDALVAARGTATDDDTVPVIVQSTKAAARADRARDAVRSGPVERAEALGVETERSLESIRAVAGEITPDEAAPLVAATTTPSGAADTSEGIQKVWLDATVEALDATSMPQIGAPDAWSQGHTGVGATVAIADTGIDTNHPDLDGGVVVLERDFSGSGSVRDAHGHGTHVASIAAGRGDVLLDQRGVAHGASLINAKVLNDEGSGELSGVIDGVEWAAQQGADVVNMSLGVSGLYTDGSDPTSQAVDRITRDHGTLVVIAAGNDGPGRTTVTVPGTSNAALTVAAVESDDSVAPFSSAGPRFGDGALKPDLSGPGVDIAAARAGYVTNTPYVRMSGTSMAAPHVAGAAAVLLAARPELAGKPEQLKAILMGSAEPGANTVWREGSGRVDVPAALRQRVVASPASLSFGRFEWPQGGLPPESRTLTYANPTSQPVTLQLAAAVRRSDGTPAPAGAVTLGSSTLTVPAAAGDGTPGSASVDVRVDPTLGAIDLYGGGVTATASDGTTIRTALGYEREPEMYDLNVVGTDRDGSAADAEHDYVFVASLSDPDWIEQWQLFGDDGTVELRVPPGTYAVTGGLESRTSTGRLSSQTLAMAPQVNVSTDSTVQLDARRGVPVSLRTHRASEHVGSGLAAWRLHGDVMTGATMWAPRGTALYAVPTGPVTLGELDVGVLLSRRQPLTATRRTPSYTYDGLYEEQGRVPSSLTYRMNSENSARLTMKYRGLGRPARAGEVLWGETAGELTNVVRTGPTPRTMTQYVSTADGVRWRHFVSPNAADPFGGFSSSLRRYRAGQTVTHTWLGQVHHGGFAPWNGDAFFSSVTRTGNRLSATLPLWVDDAGHPSLLLSEDSTRNRLRIWRGDRLVADQRGFSSAEITGPSEARTYRIRHEVARRESWWSLSTDVRTEWTFRSGRTTRTRVLPLLEVDYGVRGLDSLNRARRGTTLGLSVSHQAESRSTSEIRGLKLWWAGPRGQTWHPVEVRPGARNGRFWATVRVPATVDAVSLRVEAWDAAGNRVTERVLRAYALR